MTNPISRPSTHAVLLACGLAGLAFVGIPSLGSARRSSSQPAATAPIELSTFEDSSLNQARTTAVYLRESDGALVTVSVATVQDGRETYGSWAARHAQAVQIATDGLVSDALPPLSVGGLVAQSDLQGAARWTDDSGRITDLRVHPVRGAIETHIDALNCFTSWLAPAAPKP